MFHVKHAGPAAFNAGSATEQRAVRVAWGCALPGAWTSVRIARPIDDRAGVAATSGEWARGVVRGQKPRLHTRIGRMVEFRALRGSWSVSGSHRCHDARIYALLRAFRALLVSYRPANGTVHAGLHMPPDGRRAAEIHRILERAVRDERRDERHIRCMFHVKHARGRREGGLAEFEEAGSLNSSPPPP